ncbi:MAG: hypothetical protein IT250_17330 [Chitinophagaceae bacterium]|nr:hypothetical protein [Chitinophagaceae bacterium]
MLRLLSGLFEAMIRNISGGAGRRLRYWYYRKKLGGCGNQVFIDVNVTFLNPGSIFIGDKVWIDNGAILMAGKPGNGRKSDIRTNQHYEYGRGELHIGSEVHIGPQVILQGHGGISVGNKLTIAGGTKVYSLSHHYKNTTDKPDSKYYFFGSMVSPDEQFLIECPVVIKDGAGIGLNCVLLPGAVVPRFTWLGTGVVLKNENLEEFSIYQNEQTLLRKGIKNENEDAEKID